MSDTKLEDVKLAARWVDDCQGKKDYDAPLLRLSTRYWPRGGGYSILNTATGHFAENDSRPEIRPSAHSSILWGSDDDYATLLDKEFEADTEADVKAMVEKWAADEFVRIRNLLRSP